jgi:hypothetical protein
MRQEVDDDTSPAFAPLNVEVMAFFKRVPLVMVLLL